MIIYLDIISKLSKAGYNTARIRREHLLSEQTLTNIRKGCPISLKTLDTICELTGLPVEQLIKYV